MIALELVNHTSSIMLNWYKLPMGKREVKYLEMSKIIFGKYYQMFKNHRSDTLLYNTKSRR